MRNYTAKEFGYKRDDILMNPLTGSTASAQEWADDIKGWLGDDQAIYEQYMSLVHVFWDSELEEWKEVTR